MKPLAPPARHLRVDLLGLLAVALLTGCAVHEYSEIYPYHSPLASPGAQLAAMPPAVVSSVRAQAGPAEIYDIRKLHHSERVIYQIIFSDSALNPPLYVASDGSVLYPDLITVAVSAHDTIGPYSGGSSGGLKFSDLPIAVANTIHEKAPTAEVAFINKFAVGDHTYYEIAFKEPNQHARMVVGENGSVAEHMFH